MGNELLSIGLLADAHYADTNYAGRHCTDSLAKLADCVAAFNERGLSLAVDLGDGVDIVTQRKPAAECMADMTKVFSQFAGRRHMVIGNHDVDCLTKAELIALAGCEGTQPYYSFDEAGLHFVVLDTNNYAGGADFRPDRMPDDWSDAWLGRPQLAWLADDLAAAGETPTIIFAHAAIDHHEVDGHRDPHCVIDSPAAREMFARAGNVRAVFQGHYHPGRSCVQDGIPYITLPAMCEGPYSENAYAIATFHADGTITIEGHGRQETTTIPFP